MVFFLLKRQSDKKTLLKKQRVTISSAWRRIRTDGSKDKLFQMDPNLI